MGLSGREGGAGPGYCLPSPLPPPPSLGQQANPLSLSLSLSRFRPIPFTTPPPSPPLAYVSGGRGQLAVRLVALLPQLLQLLLRLPLPSGTVSMHLGQLQPDRLDLAAQGQENVPRLLTQRSDEQEGGGL